MKKGDISIEYTFIIFIGVIAVFIIIGLLTGWALDANKMMCKLTGECDEKAYLIDKQTIEVDDETSFENEIAKHAKLCYENARKGRVEGELCYTVKCVGCASIICTTNIKTIIENSLGVDSYDCDEFSGVKAIIEYDYSINKVIIK